MLTGELQAINWTLSEANNSYQDERIEATQNGGESDTFDVVVPAGTKAVVHVHVDNVTSHNTGGKTVYLMWNGGSEQLLSGQGASDSHTFTSNGSVTIGVRCSAGTHQVPHTRPITIGGKTIYSTYYTTEYWTYYQCAVTYSITISYESLLPDLKISPLMLSSEEAPVDKTVTLSFTVTNDGGRPAGEASVARVYVDDVQVGGDLPIGELAAGASEAKTLTLPRQVVGEHAVRVVVDATYRIEEVSENNNQATATLLSYERVPYTVRYDPNGGNGTMADQPFIAGTEQALRRNAFTRTDYVFKGWATEPAGEIAYEDGSLQKVLTYRRNGLVMLYAVWEAVPHTVAFDANGGTVTTETMTFSAVEPCGSLPVAYLDKNDMTSPVFVGWFTAPTGGVQVTEDSVIKGDCVIYAHYARPALKVCFDANGGAGTMADITAYSGIPTPLPRNAFTHAGYYFRGWGLTEGADIVSYKEGELWMGVEGATLYAVWEEETRHTHHFDANGGEGTMPDIVVTNDAPFTVPDCAFTKDGSVFWGWETNTAENITTYSATWKSAVELDAIARGGMQFATDDIDPWHVVEDGGQDVIQCVLTSAVVYVTNVYGQATYYIANRETGLYIQFPEEEGRYFYRFKWFYPNTMNFIWPIRFLYYDGKGWAKGDGWSSGTDWGDGYQAQTPTTWDGLIADSIRNGEDWSDWVNVSALDICERCKARWGKTKPPFCLETTYVEYSAPKPDEVALCFDPGVFVRTSYSMNGRASLMNIVVAPEAGWEASANADWLSITPCEGDLRHGVLALADNNTMDVRTGSVTITAQGTNYDISIIQAPGIASTVVTFDAQGGEIETNSVRYATGRAFGTLPTPIRQGYTFSGWYSARSGGEMVSAGTVVKDGLRALFARWSALSCTVTFDANGGSGGTTRTQNCDETLGALPTATRLGCVFDGWFTSATGGIMIAASAKVAANVTLYAHWTENRGNSGGGKDGGQGGGSGGSDISDPVTPGHGFIEVEVTDIIAPYEAPKAVTLQGAVYDGDGAVVGVVELKLGKVNAMKKTSKVSGSFTGLDGRKSTMKAVTVAGVDGSAPATVSLAVKGRGTMTVTIGGDQFAGSLGDWHVQSADVGGEWTGDAAASVVADDLSMFAGTVLEELLPVGDGETVKASGGKWKFDKAAGVKWAKPKKGVALTDLDIYDEESGKGLVVDVSGGKTNLSAMKLAYTPKRGVFKGSFKVCELQGEGRKTKLKKYTVKVNGVVVDGVGSGEATCKKPALSWPVEVR